MNDANWLVAEARRLDDPEHLRFLRSLEWTAPVLRLDDDIAVRRSLPDQAKRRLQIDRNIARYVRAVRADMQKLLDELGA